jgi:glycosyltransferase involved in cell wall biosynthesis
MKGAAPVAAILPLFNGHRFVRQAIESILAQQPGPAEIVVVDDGSTDGGAQLLAGMPGLRIVRQANAGEASARNHGIRETTAPLIAFLDQDDLWTGGKLSLQVGLLEGEPSIDIVYGQHRLFVEDGARWFRPRLLDRSLAAELPGAMLVRRRAFERIGPFCEDMRLGSDVDWIWRAYDAGIRSRAIEEVVLLRRMHRANASIDRGAFMDSLLRAARESIHRKRSRVASGGPDLSIA